MVQKGAAAEAAAPAAAAAAVSISCFVFIFDFSILILDLNFYLDFVTLVLHMGVVVQTSGNCSVSATFIFTFIFKRR